MGFTLQRKQKCTLRSSTQVLSARYCFLLLSHMGTYLGDCSADQYFIHFSGWKSNLLLSRKNSVEPMNLQISHWVIRTPFSSVASFFLWFLHICTYEDLHIDTVVRTIYREKKIFYCLLIIQNIKSINVTKLRKQVSVSASYWEFHHWLQWFRVLLLPQVSSHKILP